MHKALSGSVESRGEQNPILTLEQGEEWDAPSIHSNVMETQTREVN